MFRWSPYPFLRITPVFILGILISLYTDIGLPYALVGSFLVLYAAMVVFTPKKYLFQISPLLGLIGLLSVTTAGMVSVQLAQPNDSATPSTPLAQFGEYYTGHVRQGAELRTRSYRAIIALESVVLSDSAGTLQKPQPATGNVLLYQPLADSAQQLQEGNHILVKGKPQAIAPPGNPGAFDLQKYWSYQQVYHQHYLPAENWKLLSNASETNLKTFAQSIRAQSAQFLSQAIPDTQAQGIALALTLGIKDQLDEVVREAYTRAGAMHVLAVSGLHVGIVYLVIAFLLQPLRRLPKFGKVLHALLCMTVLWLFALVAGGTASVVRAATMFSFVIIAEALHRRANIYNTITASAFALLCYNPYYIVSVGFQLSYIAVLGIVYLQPKIYRWWSFDFWLWDKIWALTAVSLAAQIATFPISVYYFHQFPTYFWLSNLIVIPAAFVILSLGLLVVGVGFLAPVLLPPVGTVLQAIIQGVNALVGMIEWLPASSFTQLYLDFPQLLLLYGGIVTWLMLFHDRKLRYALYGCGCFLLFSGWGAYRVLQQQQSQGITFYQVNRQTNVDFFAGHTNYHYGDWNRAAQYRIENHHLQAGLVTSFANESDRDLLPKHEDESITWMVWQGKTVAIIKKPISPTSPSEKITVDYLVISHDAIKSLSEVNSIFDYQLLVIDGSNRYYLAEKLVREAQQRGVVYHSVRTQGALRVAL